MRHLNLRLLRHPLGLACGFALASAACVITTSDGDTDDGNASASQGSSASETDSASASASASGTDSASASATNAEVTSDVGETSETTPDTTTETGVADDTTGSESTGEVDDTGSVGTTCGWVAESNFYACGGMGEEPKGLIPIECVEPPVAGAPCDGDQGPIADPGCCAGDLNAYCYQGQLIVEDCSMTK